MKKWFNHTKKPYRKWDEYEGNSYDWDSELEEEEEYYASEESGAYADDLYFQETDIEEPEEAEYYAEEEREFLKEPEEAEYYAEESDYASEESVVDFRKTSSGASSRKKKRTKSGPAVLFDSLRNRFLEMGTMDKVITSTGAAVLMLALVTGSIYASSRIDPVSQEGSEEQSAS